MAARVGLTGGIGSGKSTVLALFRDLGVPIISADDVARKLSTRGSPEFEKILEEFSDTVLGPDGEINRGKLGSIVFDDEEKRARLEAILHPGIRKEMLRFADKSSAPYCILEIPLLIETGQYREINLRKIQEQNAIYYISEFSVADRETLDFAITVTTADNQTGNMKLRQQFFAN